MVLTLFMSAIFWQHRTMAIKHISPDEAHQQMQSGSAYIDVRTEGEFGAGHPADAVNIPVAFPNRATGQMMLNDEFVAIVSAHFGKDQALILGCQSGMRSQRAAEMLAQAGFSSVANMRGGFGGSPDSAGWASAGLPTSTTVDDTNSYPALKAKK
jgi:rhodanese-related sulfurtransferase